MTPRTNRRQFLQNAGMGAAGFWIAGRQTGFGQDKSPNAQVNIACIGTGGQGGSDMGNVSKLGNIVALCDIDDKNNDKAGTQFPKAKKYFDYRKMLDEIPKEIDCVTVGIPDNHHACASIMAMKLGKGAYTQKPLTHDIYEARQMTEIAAKYKVATQMGNQGSAGGNLRESVEIVQAGLIGEVKEVHLWTNRPIWPQSPGVTARSKEGPPPAHVHWDEWLGPAPERPYSPAYHPFKWRGWWDFGTGALGDMACHTVNLPFRAINMGYPTSIEAESSGMNGETYPLGSKIKFEFPERTEGGKKFAAATFHWYDGGKPKPGNPYDHDGSNKPASDITADLVAMMGEVPGSGCLIIGDKGKVFSPEDYGTQFFIKLKDEPKYVYFRRHPAVEGIPVTLPRNPFQGDFDMKHHLEWIKAIKDNQPEYCYSRFAITAYLTEIMLLGCVALRVGKKIEWDGPGMVAKNAPEAAQFVKRTNRDGWTV